MIRRGDIETNEIEMSVIETGVIEIIVLKNGRNRMVMGR